MRKMFLDWFTENNGTDFDMVRCAAFGGATQYFFMSGYQFINDPIHFDIHNFAVGLSVVIAALGAAVGFNKMIESKQ